jgi:radical SAM superfamily enzyme YgiQ (UPF0313 family)
MYDVVLISTHYNYTSDGKMIPSQDTEDFEDLSMIVPLGIIHIAQYLNDCGFKVRVVHLPHEMHVLRHFGIDEDYINDPIEKILRNYPARVCGIQAHWYLYCGGAVFISNLYKKLFPDSKIFFGGYMAATCWKEFLGLSEDIDGVILGEGEKTFRRILEKNLTVTESNLQDVNGVAFRDGNHDFIFNPPGKDCNLELDELPIISPEAPPFANIFWQKRHFINVSRGLCPERCSYCVGNNKVLNSRTYQTLKLDKILEQLHVFQESGVQRVFFGENHFLNMSFMTELIESIIGENLDLYFELETHPVIFERSDLLEKMIEAKFLRFTMGCESGSDSVLKRIGRNSDSKQILNSVKRIAESGGIVLTSWISNLPGETDSEFHETRETLQQVVKAGGFIYWIENLHVLPGTQLYENPENWDIKLLLRNLEDWIRWSVISKHYVNFDEAHKAPLNFLTHVNRNVAPQAMIERFYSHRKLALSLMPQMKFHLEKRLPSLPSDIFDAEMQRLEWYETNGWKLWLI